MSLPKHVHFELCSLDRWNLMNLQKYPNQAPNFFAIFQFSACGWISLPRVSVVCLEYFRLFIVATGCPSERKDTGGNYGELCLVLLRARRIALSHGTSV